MRCGCRWEGVLGVEFVGVVRDSMNLRLMSYCVFWFFFFNDTATTEIYTLSLHDALPIFLNMEPFERGVAIRFLNREPLESPVFSMELFKWGEIGRAHV